MPDEPGTKLFIELLNPKRGKSPSFSQHQVIMKTGWNVTPILHKEAGGQQVSHFLMVKSEVT